MKARRFLFTFGGLLLLLSLWWALVALLNILQYLVPRPSSDASEFYATPLEFVQHAGRTLSEALAGLLIALATGLIGGCILYRSVTTREVILPWTSALQAIPIVALAPLLVVWCGSGITSKILMSAIISFFPILTAVLVGFSEVDQDRRLLFQVYKTSYPQTLRHLLLPSALPTIIMGTKISAGLATVGAIVAEMTGADKGLGYLLLNATYRMETPRLFVAIILSGVIGWLAYSLPGIVGVLLPKYWESARREASL